MVENKLLQIGYHATTWRDMVHGSGINTTDLIAQFTTLLFGEN